MKIPAKVIATIVVVVAIAGLGLWAQRASSAVAPIRLTARDMDLLFHEVLNPQVQQRIASDPDGKKSFIEGFKTFLALAQQAESEGYAERLESQISREVDRILAGEYFKKHPDVKVSDQEIDAYFKAHPEALKDIPEPGSEQAVRGRVDRRSVGEMKILAERARGEGLDQDDLVKVKVLFRRSQLLYETYGSDLEKKVESQITNEEAEQYYKTHPGEFEKVFVRHIVISKEPPEQVEDDAGEPAPTQPALTPEQAREKAEAILARARSGEDFAKLAAENSDDPSGKENGGELGYVARGALSADFKNLEDKVLSLKAGEVALVESPLGYQIIKAESREPIAAPNDPRVRQMIKDRLKGERLQERVKQIVESSRVEIADNFDITPKQPAPPAQQQ